VQPDFIGAAPGSSSSSWWNKIKSKEQSQLDSSTFSLRFDSSVCVYLTSIPINSHVLSPPPLPSLFLLCLGWWYNSLAASAKIKKDKKRKEMRRINQPKTQKGCESSSSFLSFFPFLLIHFARLWGRPPHTKERERGGTLLFDIEMLFIVQRASLSPRRQKNFPFFFLSFSHRKQK
jgi:hypothetical protein